MKSNRSRITDKAPALVAALHRSQPKCLPPILRRLGGSHRFFFLQLAQRPAHSRCKKPMHSHVADSALGTPSFGPLREEGEKGNPDVSPPSVRRNMETPRKRAFLHCRLSCRLRVFDVQPADGQDLPADRHRCQGDPLGHAIGFANLLRKKFPISLRLPPSSPSPAPYVWRSDRTAFRDNPRPRSSRHRPWNWPTRFSPVAHRREQTSLRSP